MRIAAFSDVHAHIYKEFDSQSGVTGSQRLDNIVSSLAYIRQWCSDNGVKYVLFAGDMFHVRGKVDTLVFNAVYDEIERFNYAGIKIIMIAGNHDQYDNSDVPENSIHAFKKLKGVYVYDTVGTHPIYGQIPNPEDPTEDLIYTEALVVCAPYSKNVQMVKDYITSVEKKDIPQILLFHLGISGAFVGSGSYPMADAFTVDDLRPDLFKYIIGGHFHRRQFLGGHKHALYCGAPLQHSFGDEGEDKGFYVVDTNKRWDVEFVPIPNPKFVTLTGDALNKHEAELKWCAEEGDYVRIQCTESQLVHWQTIIPEGLNYKVELQKEYEEQSRSDVKIGMSFEAIVAKYAEENNPDAKDVGLSILKEVMDE